ncbi:CaiB/BaiF CoA-transferase family protein [Pseudoruegeria sp. HB172150]|uniref:CaiB/BaiF CoA transferase family protein n=1 Tax=Pseudoruegeria sp. HB172150 TaxID=2721164 RepID=UPI0015521654|nr:CoA transferase [Pseudoruegeria sp. HB172150]
MLNSFRILDLTWVLGGPFAGQLLAQLGADVIKVETLSGDFSRSVPPHFIENDSAYYLSVNRGKRGIALDLKSPEGMEVFRDLVRSCDAVVYGFAPDVPKRLGIDYESLSEINPKICVAELIGLHDQGDYSRAPAYDLIVQAMGGVMSITGEEDGSPVRVGYQIGDLSGGLYLALGLTAALARAAREGQGAKVQISLYDCQVSLLTWQAQNYFASGTIPVARGSRNPVLTPSEVYRCADGRYLAVSPTGDAFWKKFCELIGRPDLPESAEFGKRPDRLRNADALIEILADIFSKKPAEDWVKMFFEARVPAALVQNVAEAVSHPVAQARRMVDDVPNPATGSHVKFLGNPFKFSGQPQLGYPPRHGGNTEEVLSGVLDYSPEKIKELVAVGAVGTGTPAKAAE